MSGPRGGCGIDPGGMQDLPHRGGRDPVAELDEFALHPTVPHVGLSVAMRITAYAAGYGRRRLL